MFKDKPWKEWKTRKTVLIFSVLCVCAYTVFGIILAFADKSLDSALTEQLFSFFKWLVVTGCAITISKVFKGKTNTDCDETFHDQSSELESDEEYSELDEISLEDESISETEEEINN